MIERKFKHNPEQKKSLSEDGIEIWSEDPRIFTYRDSQSNRTLLIPHEWIDTTDHQKICRCWLFKNKANWSDGTIVSEEELAQIERDLSRALGSVVNIHRTP